jgi:hypothetical protein
MLSSADCRTKKRHYVIVRFVSTGVESHFLEVPVSRPYRWTNAL